MRQPWEYEEQDLLDLIRNKVPESLTIDYKQSSALGQDDQKKNELSKDVSAFANSAGGTLIYGVIEKNGIPEKLDDGVDSSRITEEWLQQVINTRIERRIDGVRIKSITLEKRDSERVAYVIHVPQSMRAPHQAADKRFYKRYNRESTAMHEYEIRDVARRQVSPELQMSFSFPSETLDFDPDPSGARSEPLHLHVNVENKAAAPVFYAHFDVFIDNEILVDLCDGWERSTAATFEINGRVFCCNRLSRSWSIPARMPIWEGMRYPLGNGPLHICLPIQTEEYLIAWRARSPHMSTKGGLNLISLSGASARISSLDAPVDWE